MPFSVATTKVPLKYRKFADADEERIIKVLRAGEDVEDKRGFFDKHFTSLADKALVRAIALRDHMPRRIAWISISGGILATPAGNAFVEYQLALKAAFPENRIFWVDLTNGCTPYIPTRLGAALGGYEAESAIYEADAGERILEAGKKALQELFAAGKE